MSIPKQLDCIDSCIFAPSNRNLYESFDGLEQSADQAGSCEFRKDLIQEISVLDDDSLDEIISELEGASDYHNWYRDKVERPEENCNKAN